MACTFKLITFAGITCALMAAWPAQAQQFTVKSQHNIQAPARALDAPHHRHRPVEQLFPYAPLRIEAGNGNDKPESSHTLFSLPLRPGLSNPLENFHTVSAFLDHDEAFPDMLQDWNCGMRAYDTDTFNHNGTDYVATTGFAWLTMQQDGLAVIAAADGVIVDRHDGEPDQSCEFADDVTANLVQLRHADGSQSAYAHMKTGTVTPRQVGDSVQRGDYLGIVGSSGISSGPHLHFMAWDSGGNLVDPYAGNCNLLNNESWWQQQEAYVEKRLIRLTTHGAIPEFPPCPGIESPHFQTIFTTEEDIFLAAWVRDMELGEKITAEFRSPEGAVLLTMETTLTEPEFAAWNGSFWSISSPTPVPAGIYTWAATFAGITQEIPVYVGVEPEAPAPGVTANNAWAGLWYDPLLDGEGFNVVPTSGGTIVYFYGSDQHGNRLWLVSDFIPGTIVAGQELVVTMYESTGGVFPTPVASGRGLSPWGTLTFNFADCESGISTLDGKDGIKVSQIIKLVGISGVNCVEGDLLADAEWSGLWYDPALDGEGYNFIVSPVGRIIYFYGFKANGLRLWLVSDVLATTLEVGQQVVVDLFEATQGTFDNPVPSGTALVKWGTATMTVIDCNTMTVVITGTDGDKTSNTLRLTGIVGQQCND